MAGASRSNLAAPVWCCRRQRRRHCRKRPRRRLVCPRHPCPVPPRRPAARRRPHVRLRLRHHHRHGHGHHHHRRRCRRRRLYFLRPAPRRRVIDGTVGEVAMRVASVAEVAAAVDAAGVSPSLVYPADDCADRTPAGGGIGVRLFAGLVPPPTPARFHHHHPPLHHHPHPHPHPHPHHHHHSHAHPPHPPLQPSLHAASLRRRWCCVSGSDGASAALISRLPGASLACGRRRRSFRWTRRGPDAYCDGSRRWHRRDGAASSTVSSSTDSSIGSNIISDIDSGIRSIHICCCCCCCGGVSCCSCTCW